MEGGGKLSSVACARAVVCPRVPLQRRLLPATLTPRCRLQLGSELFQQKLGKQCMLWLQVRCPAGGWGAVVQGVPAGWYRRCCCCRCWSTCLHLTRTFALPTGTCGSYIPFT